jgi:hypothetical protein
MSYGDDEPKRPPMHTPIPLNVDRRIDARAVELADCRTDLTDSERHMLARVLAYRARSFKRIDPRK